MSTAITPPRPIPVKKTFQDWVNADSFKKELANALPKHLTPDRFIRVLLTATMRNPRLLECTQESLFKTIFDAAALGLELDGRRAHAVPYRNNKKNCYECQLLVDYKGLVELALRSGTVSSIHADTVCENDEFEVDRGLITKHKINYREDRGKPYAAYCIVRFRDGGEKCEVMTRDEVYAIRSRSRSKDDGPWVTDEFEMWKKTAARRAMKWVPLSAEIRDLAEREDALDFAKNVTPPADTGRGLVEALEMPKEGFSMGEPQEPQKVDASQSEDQPAEPVSQTKQKAPPVQLPPRANVVAGLEAHMLALGVPESKVWKWASEVWPHECDACQQLMNLPTEILLKIKEAVPSMAKS